MNCKLTLSQGKILMLKMVCEKSLQKKIRMEIGQVQEFLLAKKLHLNMDILKLEQNFLREKELGLQFG